MRRLWSTGQRNKKCLGRVMAWLIAAAAAFALISGPLGPAGVARAQNTPNPETVTIASTFQDELGCPGAWQPECPKTFLTYDAEDDVWQGRFILPANADEKDAPPRYKAALNGSWDENYGGKAQRNGPDIPLLLAQPAAVKFYYDHKTHWVTDSFNSVIATAVGDFQSELGCARDGDPGCLRSWLEDPAGTGILSMVTNALPAGTYHVQVALGEALDETYGEGGAEGGAPIEFTLKEADTEVYFGYDPASHALTVSTEGAPHGNLGKAQAHWVTADTLMWNVTGSPRYRYELDYSADGQLKLEVGAITGGTSLPLTFTSAGPGKAVLDKFPHLGGYTTLKLSPADLAKVPDILKGQFAVAVRDDQGKLIDATSVQIPGVLDDLYRYDGPLGVSYDGLVPTLRVWAPSARHVSLLLFAGSSTPQSERVPMQLDAASGVWSATGTPDWTGSYYLYQVEVFVPQTGKFEQNQVTDPYSLSLSTNSLRSQIVNLAAPSLKPQGWDSLAKPALSAPEDIVVYELHVRDFSMHDPGVPEAERGTFKAFTEQQSAGMQHLRALAKAGLTHIHLLPAFDFASVDEDKSTWQSVDEAELSQQPPDSQAQQAAVAEIRDLDGFNWGYDPLHYTVPEGSYATNPDGPARIREFREMVQALNQAGLRVVLDVVYNHTNASGQSAKSVLDKIVPGYYHRLNADGQVETSTCCQNTASEHAMMEKLMIDSLLTWAAAYKVDGFRFDLMGHHMLANMQHVRAALDALTPSADGVDGRQIYVYGEGWNFGEVADNARGQNATQLNIGGTGIGVFNDRLRDAARGGGPFDDPRAQGFLTGLFDDPNDFGQGEPAEQRDRLLHYTDWIRLGLAGNLKGYVLVNAAGQAVPGWRIDYKGSPAGYTLDPQENIVYVSAHDNESLFDAIQWKAPISATVADRVRMQNLGVSLALLAQGVPFFQAGDDLLRSKSLDGNSYNSGDWFNRLDFTYQTNNWGVGLPPGGADRWPLMQPLLANPDLKPQPADIDAARLHFQEMLAIRRSSRLFRLETAEAVQQRLKFYNVGPDQIPGLIVMDLENIGAGRLDDPYDRIVVLFNAAREAQSFGDASFAGAAFRLHPIQQASGDALLKTAAFDSSSGTFSVPSRTAAVFVVEASAPAVTATPAITATSPATAGPTRMASATSAATNTPAAVPTARPSSPSPTASPASPVQPAARTTTVLAGLAAVVLLAAGAVFVWLRRIPRK